MTIRSVIGRAAVGWGGQRGIARSWASSLSLWSCSRSWVARRMGAVFDGEFANPSPNGLPAVSVYNTTPANCPVTISDLLCLLD